MKPLTTMCLLALALLSELAQGQNRTINNVTLSGTMTDVAAPVVTNSGATTRTIQSLRSFRFGNREILQLMVSNSIIPTITGYSLIQKFENDGTPIGYFARSTTGAETAADPAIFGFTPVGSVVATSTSVTRPTTPTGTTTTTGTTSSKVMATLSLGGTNCTLFNTVTKTLGRTARLNNVTVRFTGVASQGKLLGSFGPNGPMVDATLDTNTTRPITGP